MNTPTTGRVLVTTYPFGEIDHDPIELLKTEGIPFDLNPAKRRLREHELAELIGPYEALIAGTEPITRSVLERAGSLRLIARVGIGLDSVALGAARARGIAVTYTPSAPSPAVAELAVGQMLALLRRTFVADGEIRRGVWHRRIGRRLGLMTVGVIGVGRIGSSSSSTCSPGARASWRTISNRIRSSRDARAASGPTWTPSAARLTSFRFTSH